MRDISSEIKNRKSGKRTIALMFLLYFAAAFLLSVALISLHTDCDCMRTMQRTDCCTPIFLQIDCDCKKSTMSDFYPVCFLVINKLEIIKQLMIAVALAFVTIGLIFVMISIANNLVFKFIFSNIIEAKVRMNN